MSNAGDPRGVRELRETAARKYLPEKVDLLLVAESPPAEDDRYFYFEHVESNDWLFRGVAEMLLGEKPRRSNKANVLAQLKKRGTFLIDLKIDPTDGSNLAMSVPDLVRRCAALKPRRIILIKATVYDAAYLPLVAAGLPVINKRVYFPSTGRQLKFKKQFAAALRDMPRMRGKATFTQRDAEIIRQKLREVRRSDRDLQKTLRGKLRDMGFYISDFTSSSKGFTAGDFDELVERGSITII